MNNMERIKYLDGTEQVVAWTRIGPDRYRVSSTVYGPDGYYRPDVSMSGVIMTMDEIDHAVDRFCEGR